MCDILLNHRNSRFLLLNHLRDDSLFAQWKGLQDLINVLVFQCKQLRQSLDLVLGQVESCQDWLNVALRNPDVKEPGLDLSKFRNQPLLFLGSRRGGGKREKQPECADEPAAEKNLFRLCN